MIGYQLAAVVLRENGNQSRYHAERYVYNYLRFACISLKKSTGSRMLKKKKMKIKCLEKKENCKSVVNVKDRDGLFDWLV